MSEDECIVELTMWESERNVDGNGGRTIQAISVCMLALLPVNAMRNSPYRTDVKRPPKNEQKCIYYRARCVGQ